MKKFIFLLFMSIMLTINVSAQFKPFQFGLKIAPGINWIQLDSDELYDSDNKFNFDWGFFGSVYFVENYGITSGFNVLSMKSNYCYNIYDIGQDIDNKIVTKVNVKYVEIPLLLTMRTDMIGSCRLFGQVGYGFGILTTNKTKVEYDNIVEIDIFEPSFYNIRNSLIIGLGVEYKILKSSSLTAAIVYNDNFTNVIKGNNNNNQDIKLNTIALEIGFVF